MGNNGSGKVDMTTEPPPVMSASTFNPTLSQASTSLPTPSSTIGDVEMVVTADAELIATVPVPSTSAIDPPAAKVQDEGESESESSDEEYDSEEDYEPAGWDGIRRRKRKNDGKIHPAYYYPSENLEAKGVPVFEPTMEEFQDFYKFIQAVDSYGMKSGIVKVVPPKGWSDALPDVSAPLKAVRLRNPIDQHFIGQTGLFRCTNVAKGKIYNAKQWRDLTVQSTFDTPDFFAKKEEESTPGKRPTRATRGKRRQKSDSATPAPSTPAPSEDPLPTPLTLDAASLEAMELEAKMEDAATKLELDPAALLQVKSEAVDPDTASIPDSSPTKEAKKAKSTAMSRADITDEEWAQWEGQWNGLPHNAQKTDFTVEACHEIERRYWRTLLFGEPPKYGADLAGSLFTTATKHWNVASLDNLFSRLKLRNLKLPGVTTPYLYFGMWRATFSWHVEDADLYSINYIHFGAPKFWYSVPQEHHERFERVMAGWFPNDRAKCPAFLRHKSFLASPHKLASQNIPLNKVVQLPGEFILTYPHGYHSGFNLGFNCAESINFATETWIDIGREANYCRCMSDSVTINVDELLEQARTEAEALNGGPSAKRKHLPSGEGVKALKRIKLEPKGPPPPPPKCCVYCPDRSTDTLVPLAVAASVDGPEKKSKPRFAHKVCVGFLPTTWLGLDETTAKEVAYGFESVEKARWNLKCGICENKDDAKYGAKIQCTKNEKCVRAYHITCALADNSGVFMDMVETVGGKDNSLLHPSSSPPAPKPMELPPITTIIATSPEETSDSASSAPTVETPATSPAESAKLLEATADDPAQAAVNASNAAGGAAGGSTFRVVVLCKLHNPEYVEAQKVQQSAELQKKVAGIPVGAPLKVKTSGGIFIVTLLEDMKSRSSVRVSFEDNKQGVYKYGAIIWRDIDESKIAKVTTKEPVQNPYAKEFTRPSVRQPRLLPFPGPPALYHSASASGSAPPSSSPPRPAAYPNPSSSIHSLPPIPRVTTAPAMSSRPPAPVMPGPPGQWQLPPFRPPPMYPPPHMAPYPPAVPPYFSSYPVHTPYGPMLAPMVAHPSMQGDSVHSFPRPFPHQNSPQVFHPPR